MKPVFVFLPHPSGLRFIPANDSGEDVLFAATFETGAVTLTYPAAAQFLGEIITEIN